MTTSLSIDLVPVLEDNYTFFVSNLDTAETVVIDPAVDSAVDSFLSSKGFQLKAILNTHHHWDHVGANESLIKRHHAQVFGAEHDSHRIPGISTKVKDGDVFSIIGCSFRVLEVPGHTRGHIAFQTEIHGQTQLFIGDTLFGGGCGKLFEGTPAEMLESLRKVRKLPDSTQIWCAHEYTEKNYWVACQLEPENKLLHDHYESVRKQRKEGVSTVPLSLRSEKAVNPFLRWDDSQLQKCLGLTGHCMDFENCLNAFTAVRNFRDRF